MNLLSKLSSLPTHPVRAADLEEADESLKEARRLYRQSSMDLFDLCYKIQTSDELPEPTQLTLAVLKFQYARHAMETMEAEMLAEMTAM